MELNLQESPPTSPKKRRRSSFFDKRLSTNFLPLKIEDDVCVDPEQHPKEQNENNLQRYTELLLEECVAWRNYYTEKKTLYEGGRKKLKESLEPVTEDCLRALLRPEDAAFLETKPDLAKVCGDWSKLCRDLNLCLAVETRRAAAVERMNLAMDEKIESLQREILDFSCLTE